ncbi:MAG TPA: phosphoglucosamine mutase [Gemmatimonadaceae bacterium]|nr:phosphoglucosamine mutase [Gemmatimonadaceae bacterium]
MAFQDLMVSVSGVRGRVGEALTPEIVARFAAGFAAWSLGRGHSREIVVGRDSRVSGPMFHHAVTAALQSVGAAMIDLGVVPTPTVQLEVERRHAAGGLAITASHNPIDWNALKFIGASGLFLDAREAASMRTFVDRGFARASWDQLGTVESDAAAVQRHIDRILGLPFIDVAAIRQRRLLVALDTCHGAGAVIMPQLLERLGCEVVSINLTPDGRFHRPPEPVAENLGELGDLVRRSGAAVGLATDPDVDRLALVDETGRAIGEDYTLALACRVVLRRQRGPVVINLSTSRIVEDVAAEFGSTVLRAPVGEVNVAVRMRDEGAVIGGEGNGGVILPALHLGRDAPLAAALTLQLLVDGAEGGPGGARPPGASLSSVVAQYPQYRIVKDKLERPAGTLEAVYEALRSDFPDAVVDTQDGLRLTWPDRWVHVRPSGTEPIVRVIAEAPSDREARDLISRCRAPLDALAA